MVTDSFYICFGIEHFHKYTKVITLWKLNIDQYYCNEYLINQDVMSAVLNSNVTMTAWCVVVLVVVKVIINIVFNTIHGMTELHYTISTKHYFNMLTAQLQSTMFVFGEWVNFTCSVSCEIIFQTVAK